MSYRNLKRARASSNLAKFVTKRRRTAAQKKFTDRQVGLFGANPFVVMPYYETAALNAINSSYVFRLGSLYDPDVTGTGHQPCGFDQMSALYYHYIVDRVDITVEAVNNSTTVDSFVGISIDRSGSAITDLRQVGEDAGGLVTYLDVKGSGKSTKKWKKTCYPGRFLGIANPHSEDDLWGSVTSNPNQAVFLQLHAESADGTSTASTYFLVHFKYYTTWRERRQVALS